ncbi:tyrosinase family protein [Sphingomonas sp. R-74633]|uniref:tyrosinase family protein n=1 Tax=Sphingomonas sp. R-74633 TaxID=2751188 RepID=UPI0015D36FF6|nr:tyrosinase family protein [Sphingomonas sp. R-74633]NYT39471.1 tyrosinase family protein [Sphingomonas sp. R-74633]
MLSRREIIAMLAAGAAAPAWALTAPAQPRLPWAEFRRTPDYPRLVEAVRRMKANPNADSPASWGFWPMVHMHHCPHGQPYFLAWHRGYLHLFEAKLREISGSTTLRVPYWDYFADPRIPAEFSTGNSATNPLFEPRIGGEVGKALGFAAFAPRITGFQRGGSPECFEAEVEGFHNKVHNLVGGRMATMLSPSDMIFWVHHANVDRLWAAWSAAGEGRAMPPAGDAYWAGRFDYAEGVALDRNVALDGAGLGYRYPDLKLPVGEAAGGAIRSGEVRVPHVPPPVRGAPVIVQAPPPPPVEAPPPAPVEAAPPMAMAPPPAAAAPAPVPYRGIWLGGSRYQREPLQRSRGASYVPDEVTIVLDQVSLSGAGQLGGYFYDLYLDLDGEGRTVPECLLGSIGPFQIAAARHHSDDGMARLELPVGEVIRREAQGLDLADLGVVFHRVEVQGAAEGETIAIGSIEVAG